MDEPYHDTEVVDVVEDEDGVRERCWLTGQEEVVVERGKEPCPVPLCLPQDAPELVGGHATVRGRRFVPAVGRRDEHEYPIGRVEVGFRVLHGRASLSDQILHIESLFNMLYGRHPTYVTALGIGWENAFDRHSIVPRTAEPVSPPMGWTSRQEGS